MPGPLTPTVPPLAFLYVPDFFKTNRIFTDSDQELIRKRLDSAEANLLHVHELMQDDAIDEKRVQDLSHQKVELVDLIERCRIALAPIKELPDDVLRYIFTIYCEDRYLSLNRDGIFLIKLCSVCSGWRSIALEIPILWSQVYLSASESFSYSHNNVEEAMKLWFSRAGTCPISLKVDGYCFSEDETEEFIDLAERIIILPSCYRRLSLTMPVDDMEVLLRKFSPDQLRQVEVLWAIEDDFFAPIREDVEPLPFSHSTFPNLKNLELSYCWNLNNLTSLFPFPQLQKLNVKLTMSLTLELLQQSSLLEECDIVIEPSDSIVPSLLANRACYVTLPRLRHLSIAVDDMEDCCILIDQLVLNNLQHFDISAMHESESHSNELSQHLAALSQRSCTPNLSYLSLTGGLAPNRDIGILLRGFPHLEMLTMCGCAIIDEETLDEFARGTLVPRLNCLHVDRIQPNYNVVKKIAEKRAQYEGMPKLRLMQLTIGMIIDPFI